MNNVLTFRPVKGAEKYYYVNNRSRIFSLISHKFLKRRIDKKGYDNAKLKGLGYVKVSHIVAQAFPEICGEWFEGAEVDHRNGIRDDNRPENLLVCDHTQNINNPLTIEKYKKRKNKTHPKPIFIMGERFSSQREAALYFGVSEGYISAVKCGRIKNPIRLN